jgi:hypothetical protein
MDEAIRTEKTIITPNTGSDTTLKFKRTAETAMRIISTVTEIALK